MWHPTKIEREIANLILSEVEREGASSLGNGWGSKFIKEVFPLISSFGERVIKHDETWDSKPYFTTKHHCAFWYLVTKRKWKCLRDAKNSDLFWTVEQLFSSTKEKYESRWMESEKAALRDSLEKQVEKVFREITLRREELLNTPPEVVEVTKTEFVEFRKEIFVEGELVPPLRCRIVWVLLDGGMVYACKNGKPEEFKLSVIATLEEHRAKGHFGKFTSPNSGIPVAGYLLEVATASVNLSWLPRKGDKGEL